MNYFELYPGDYLRDTSRLSLVEHGAYLRLLMAYYAEEQPLPADLGELYIIVSAVSTADKAAVRKVADRYFPVGEDGVRHNGRADEEITKAQKRMTSSRENGSKGGRPKKPGGNLPGIPPGIPPENPPGFETGGFSEPKTKPAETHSGEALQTPDPTHTPDGLLRAENSLPTRAQPPETGEGGTAAGAACLAMRRGGIAVTNPAHPCLLAAIEEGATEVMWLHTATEASEHNPPKGFAWVIATVRGRLADAASTGSNHATSPHRSERGLADQVHIPDDGFGIGFGGFRIEDAIDGVAVSDPRS